MKNEKYRFIFDMDGTLYRFNKGEGGSFSSSQFYADLKTTVLGFLMTKKGLKVDEAIEEYERIKAKYQGEISLGIEGEYRIDRYEYFEQTWGKMDPRDYIETNEALPETLNALNGRIALLTSAPKVWAIKVLSHLNISAFEEAIYTGEPDLRKPDPVVFKKNRR